MERPTGFYPWLLDWETVVTVLGAGLACVLALYLAMRQGRMERTNKQTPGKSPIHWYAGLTSSDSNKPTLFLILLTVFLLFWVVVYIINLSIHGLGY